MKNLIIVPAREFKRLPGKNFTKLNGKPLINYTVNICKKLNNTGMYLYQQTAIKL